jgi:hypothetical protein
MKTLVLSLAGMSAFVFAASAEPVKLNRVQLDQVVAGKMAETSTSTQGNSGRTNDSANPANQGQTTTTSSGPPGQINQGNTGCNNCTTVTDGPGRN